MKPFMDPGDNPREAAKRLAAVFREGLLDTINLPQVRTDAGDVAHVLLGCIWHSAMGHLIDMTRDLDPQPPIQVIDCMNQAIDEKLFKLAFLVIRRQNPLGRSDRCTLG
jgi:hypothetical protein